MTEFTHHHLSAEQFHDKSGVGILLTQQEGTDAPDTIVVHPFQLREICEQFALITSDPRPQQTIAALQRRMVALRDRIERLSDWMAQYSDHRHADLSRETTQLNAMADLAREWCHDFDEEEPEQTTPLGSVLENPQT